MEIKEQKQLYCIIIPQSGSVSIKLTVSQMLLAGADFKIYSENKVLLEEFKLSVDNNNYALHTLRTDIKDLNKAQLACNILYCTRNPRFGEGTIKIEILQYDGTCKLDMPAEWRLMDIPPCAVNNPASLKASVVFVPKTESPIL